MPILLFLLWLAFHERITPDVLITGAICVVAVTLILYKLSDWSVKRDLQFAARIPQFLIFVLSLIVEVFKANIHMIALVLSKDPNAKIHPRIVAHKTDLRTQTGRVSLANSITLTPGTITVDVGQDTVYVHAIDTYAEAGLGSNPLETQLVNMEKSLS